MPASELQNDPLDHTATTALIESLRVTNYRALRSFALDDLSPLTVFLGPNGSGKSTVFDVLSFVSESFRFGLRHAWDQRGRAREIKTRGQDGPVEIDIKYREQPQAPLITYHLAIDEEAGGPVVVEEWLQWRRGPHDAPFRFLDFRRGVGRAIGGEAPAAAADRIDLPLRSPDLLAVNTLGQLAEHPRVATLRDFITDWYVSYLSVDDVRGQPEAGPQHRLSRTGDNLANVIQFLADQHPDRLQRILDKLAQRIPRLEKVMADPMEDGRLLLRIKDAPFDRPVLSKYASHGTLKLLAYLVVLHDPQPPQFIGIEEPENFLHPRLLPELAEECRDASGRSQLFVTTHSPFFLDQIKAHELRILHRDSDGFTSASTASDIRGIPEFLAAGASLGSLWLEGRFGAGDPLVDSGTQVPHER